MLIFFEQIAVSMGIRNFRNFNSRGVWVATGWVPCLIAMPGCRAGCDGVLCWGAAMSWWMLGWSCWGAMDAMIMLGAMSGS